jgi:hypothetical protein
LELDSRGLKAGAEAVKPHDGGEIAVLTEFGAETEVSE